jgi:hypothetical protein
LGRWGALRLRECSTSRFEELAAVRNIILRGFGGPKEKMTPVYLDTASRLELSDPIRAEIAAVFRRTGGRPVVGVHLRQADFPLLSENVYDLRQAPFSAVPVWWYEWVMERIIRRQPDVVFLVCHNGKADAVEALKRNFDICEVGLPNSYERTQVGHHSTHHPVADLFALACCPVVLATPVSSFSHYAANVLGSESVCLMPPTQMSRNAPAAVRPRVFGKVLSEWLDAGIQGQGVARVDAPFDNIDFSRPAQCEWLWNHGVPPDPDHTAQPG